MLDCVTLEPGHAASACVVWLHGLGADGHDFEPVVPELGLPRGHGVRFVFPHAPVQPVTLNNGFAMRAWFDVRNPDLRIGLDLPGIAASASAVDEVIADQIARGIPRERILLAGFSQGGVMALHIATRASERLAGAVALSCFLAEPERLAVVCTEAARATPVFLAHGTVDNIIPVARGEEAREALGSAGIAVEWHRYGMAHGVNTEEIDHIGAFIRRVLALG